MGEKEIKGRHNCLWTFSFAWRNFLHIFGKSSGFTLVELLTVIGVIGIILTAVLLILDPVAQVQKANDAKRKADLSQVQKALETYFQDNGKYPPVSSSSPLYRMVRLDGTTADWGQQFTPYMSTLPKDPISTRNYAYYTNSSRQSYYLYAALERNNDRQFCNGGNPCTSLISNGIPSNACGGTCNYGVSSTNTNP